MNLASAIIKTIYYIIFIGFTEELMYRGYIFTKLNKIYNSKIVVILITSILFSIAHLPSMQVVQIIETFIVSIIYCCLLYKFKDKSIVPLIIAHGLFLRYTFRG